MCLVMIGCLLVALISPVAAVSYQYNENEQAVPSPEGYECVKQVRSDKLEADGDWDPTDMMVGEDDNLYVLDSFSGRIHVLNKNLQYLSAISLKQDGMDAMLMGLTGLFVDGKGEKRVFYVADPDNERVIVADAQGNITHEIGRPDTELIDDAVTFAPSKVILDHNGNLYVLVPGIYMGACVFSTKQDYAFLTFIGSNTVESTAAVIADYFWKKLLNKEQVAGMRRYTPAAFCNFTLDDQGYLYTVTNASTSGTPFLNEIKKFNTNNLNILKEQNYGDFELGTKNNLPKDTSYVDIAVNAEGYLFALDANLCRVAVFTQTGERLFTFGERSNTVGAFDTLVGIDVIGQDIYVLDQHYETISLFRPTPYGKSVMDASALYVAGRYEAAEPLWQQVLNQNAGCLLAYQGIGKSLLNKERYVEAMSYFKKGYDREGYSNAFSLYRSSQMQVVFPLVFGIGIALFVILLVMDRRMKRKSASMVNPVHKSLPGKIRYSLFHPSEGGYVLARFTDQRKTMLFSLGVLILWFVLSVIDWQFSGFIFNQNDTENFELIIQLAKTFLVFALWITSGWFVSNLMNSSARLPDLIVVSAVALLPYLASVAVHTLLTNLATKEEAGFITAIQVVLIIWAVALLLGGLKEVHEISLFKTILSVIFTLLGIALILFMGLLLWSLLQQVFSFGTQIITEIIKMIG